MRDYEIMAIHRPELAEDDIDTKVTELEAYLAENGAKVTKRDLWGKRRFAYEIDHMREGFYSVFYLDAEPGALDEVDRTLSLADAVVRHKFIRTDNRKPVTPA